MGASGAPRTDLTLWAANTLGRPLGERLRAALAGGFTAVSLFPIEIRRAREAGMSDADVRALFEDEGVRVLVVDPVAHWLPGSPDVPDLARDDPAYGAFEAGEVFELAEAMGAPLVTLIAVYDDPVTAEAGAEAFAGLCDRAGPHGVRLQLEFIPGTGIADLATAWEIVRLADRPNGGLILDAWHFYRSTPDFDLLASIPAGRVFAIQLDDAPLQPAPDLAMESLHGRLIPGDGELDLHRFLATLLRGGEPASIGPEVFSDSLAALAPEELGRRLGGRTRTLLEACLPG
jgi:sugar phosphate isomerase/epimerase